MSSVRYLLDQLGRRLLDQLGRRLRVAPEDRGAPYGGVFLALVPPRMDTPIVSRDGHALVSPRMDTPIVSREARVPVSPRISQREGER